MRAVILVGGEGTRLRPLTSEEPKPVVPLAGRPLMAYMLDWLAGAGVTEVVMACGFLPDRMEEVLGDGSRYGLAITYVAEPEPMGTGGALRFADEQLPGGLGERFVMCNGDVLTDLDLRRQIELHEELGAVATLGLAPVEDPTAYGLVRVNDDLSVAGFLEKPDPAEIDTDLISAGAYVLERPVLDLIEPGRNVSIEREVWPRLVGEGLYGIADREAYWLDIGTPGRYLEATADILSGRARTAVAAELDADGLLVAPGARVEGDLVGPAMVGEGAVIEAGAVVGPGSVLGPGATVASGARVVRSVVLDRSRVEEDAVLEDAIVAADARIGAGSEVTGLAVIGPRAVVGAQNRLKDGVRLFPGVELGERAVAS